MRQLALITILLTGTILFAQDIDISFVKSAVFKEEEKTTKFLFAESDGNGGLITVSEFYKDSFNYNDNSKTGYYINQYDSNLKLIQKFTIDATFSLMEGIIVKDNKIHLIEVSTQSLGRTFKYNVLSSPIEKFNFTKKTFLAVYRTYFNNSIDRYGGVFFGMGQGNGNPLKNLVFSENKKFFSIRFNLTESVFDKENYKIYVFNNKFEQEYVSEFEREIVDKKFKYQGLKINDEDGTVYFVGKSYEKKSKNRKKNKTKYHFELYKIDQNEQKTLSFNTAEYFVGSLAIMHNKDKLIGLGYYSEKSDYRYKGVFKYIINPENLNIVDKAFLPFSEQFMIDKYGKLTDKELRNIVLKKMFINTNGDIFINAEEFYYIQGYGTNTQIHGDIIATKIANNNQLLWARNINKSQRENMNYNVNSFFSTIVNDKNYFFVNISDNIRKISNDRIMFKGKSAKKSNLYVVVIDKDGNFDFKKILDDEDNDIKGFNVDGGAFVSKNRDEIVFIGKKGSKKQLLKVRIH